jgi:hypothetical protein
MLSVTPATPPTAPKPRTKTGAGAAVPKWISGTHGGELVRKTRRPGAGKRLSSIAGSWKGPPAPHLFRLTNPSASLIELRPGAIAIRRKPGSRLRLQSRLNLLGHASVKITEKHYSPWVQSAPNSASAECSQRVASGAAETRHQREQSKTAEAEGSYC